MKAAMIKMETNGVGIIMIHGMYIGIMMMKVIIMSMAMTMQLETHGCMNGVLITTITGTMMLSTCGNTLIMNGMMDLAVITTHTPILTGILMEITGELITMHIIVMVIIILTNTTGMNGIPIHLFMCLQMDLNIGGTMQLKFGTITMTVYGSITIGTMDGLLWITDLALIFE
jgi:hypothetical protein